MNLVAWWNSHKTVAHTLAGVGVAVAGVWGKSPDFRAYVENNLHSAPHWIQAIAGVAPFLALIYTSFKIQGQQ
jgi:hypothetical protein